MSEKDIQGYLNRSYGESEQQERAKHYPVNKASKQQDAFQDFSASHLYCPTCRTAMPVREHILLYLPDGDLYEFKCTRCASSLGTKKA